MLQQQIEINCFISMFSARLLNNLTDSEQWELPRLKGWYRLLPSSVDRRLNYGSALAEPSWGGRLGFQELGNLKLTLGISQCQQGF